MKHALFAVLLAVALPGCEKSTSSQVTGSSSPSPSAATPAPPTSTSNLAPNLVLKIQPHPASGRAPLDVKVNMCQSADPDGDPLVFEYRWGGTRREHFSFVCRDDHTYTVPGTYKAFFCVNDDHDHRVCRNELIVVG